MVKEKKMFLKYDTSKIADLRKKFPNARIQEKPGGVEIVSGDKESIKKHVDSLVSSGAAEEVIFEDSPSPDDEKKQINQFMGAMRGIIGLEMSKDSKKVAEYAKDVMQKMKAALADVEQQSKDFNKTNKELIQSLKEVTDQCITQLDAYKEKTDINIQEVRDSNKNIKGVFIDYLKEEKARAEKRALKIDSFLSQLPASKG